MGTCSKYSSVLQLGEPISLSAPISIKVTNTINTTGVFKAANGALLIRWSKVIGAVKYELQKQFNGGGWSTIYNKNSSGFDYTPTTSGSYKFRVRACSSAICSNWKASSSAKVLLPPPAPSSINVPSSTVTNGSIAISWSAALTAASYTLQESKNNAAWVTVTSPSKTSYTRRGRNNGSYKYRVRGCNASGCGSWRSSSPVTVYFPPTTPSSINVQSSTIANGSIPISWSGVSTAASYNLQESVNNGLWMTITSSATTSYTYDVYSSGSYKYRVQACNSSGCSGWKESSTVTVTLAPEWNRTWAAAVDDADGTNSVPSSPIDLSAAFVKGQASVNGGQAAYTIPIDLPPGRNGIQPNVSISYNSQGGSGVLGMGFSLNAGDSISRCGATQAQDG